MASSKWYAFSIAGLFGTDSVITVGFLTRKLIITPSESLTSKFEVGVLSDSFGPDDNMVKLHCSTRDGTAKGMIYYSWTHLDL